MVNRFFTPFEQFSNDVGAPYEGGFLYFYQTGTSTPLATYTNSSLTVANTNPIVLDSAGRPPSAIFLQQAAYKVVLKDADGVEIWTADPVWSSDYSTVAQFRVWAGNPNGLVSGTAGTQGGEPSSVIWDSTNNILYVCTTSGDAATAAWTAVNEASTSTTNPVPQGYLTPVSGTAIITSDSTSATAVYYTPYVGNSIPVYNGSTFVVSNFAELTLTLASQHLANTIYDVFVFNDNGTLTLVTGPAWATSTAGSGARGTGASTTQLSRISGIWVNTVQISARNGSTTYTVAANLATYVGSIFIDGSAGQVTCHRSWGQSRKWGIWNAYNRVPVYLKAGDATASWTYNSATVRASRGQSANSLQVFSGLAEEVYNIRFEQQTTTNTGNVSNSATNTSLCLIGIGLNSTTTITGRQGTNTTTTFNATVVGIRIESSIANVAAHFSAPALGVQTITALEAANTAASSNTFFGTETLMVLSATWRA